MPEETTLNLAQFSPTVAELQKAVEATKAITVSDLKDPQQLAVVKTSRIGLKNMRVAITKRGKELRDGAIKFQKAVIEKERELVAIVEPEEERLSAIEAEAEVLANRERRRDKLPWRREQLATFGAVKTDEELLDMDDDAFKALIVDLQTEKNRQEAERLAEEQRKIDAQRAEIARQEELRVAKEKAVDEERERARRADLDRREREERAARDAEERTKREATEKEAREAAEKSRLEAEALAEQARLEADKRFAQFKADHGWTEETKDHYREERVGEVVRLWKLLGTFATDTDK